MAEPQTAILGVENSVAGQRWVMRPYDERTSLGMAQRLDIPEPVSRILSQRGVTLAEAESYLQPTLKSLLPDPSCLADMDKAVARLSDAVENGSKVAVFGDYDVDGATSSAILARYFQAIGLTIDTYIPNRMREGYGPNVDAFTQLCDAGNEIIITVDCGTMAHEALAYAQNRGVDVIVSDHHQTGEAMPPCFALINPRRPDDASGLGHLAAVGVTFMLLVGLNRELRQRGFFKDATREPDLMGLMDLVALGTVCDVVPLQGVNRAFVIQGLRVMAQRGNTGLKHLSDISKLTGPPVVYDCGHRLGPRVNAGGRVGESDLGLRLLATDDPDVAAGLALRMDELNMERREIGDHNLRVAEQQVEEMLAKRNGLPPALVVTHESFHAGVIGIVASRLKDKYRRPVFVIALDEAGVGKGSARSIAGIDVGQLVAGAVSRNIISQGGGHAMAAGLTVGQDQIADFENFLDEKLGTLSFDGPRDLNIDTAISVSGANRQFLEQVLQAGPFGAGNPEPRFMFPATRILHTSIVGDGHVRCQLGDEQGGRLKAMAFSSVDEPVRQMLTSGQKILHIAGHLRNDDWQGRRDVQLMIHDVALV